MCVFFEWFYIFVYTKNRPRKFPAKPHIIIYYSVRKVSDLTFCFESLVDFNKAHLHEVILNLHTHV